MTAARSFRAAAATALAATVAACSLSAAGPTATASADNWNHRSDFLRFPAPVNYTKCKLRHIRLNGRYLWSLYYQPLGRPGWAEWADRPEPVRLRGRYRWLDCLHYHRLSSGTFPFYRHRSWIRNERTGGEIEYKQDFDTWGIEGMSGNRRYDWGSTLDHLRPR